MGRLNPVQALGLLRGRANTERCMIWLAALKGPFGVGVACSLRLVCMARHVDDQDKRWALDCWPHETGMSEEVRHPGFGSMDQRIAAAVHGRTLCNFPLPSSAHTY
jgi:hypothetical protein